MVDEQEDGPRAPTPEERARDQIQAPDALNAEGGVSVGNSESEQRIRAGGVPVEAGGGEQPGVAGALGGEHMDPSERIDADQAEQALREEDVTAGDRLSDDVRESESLPAQGEDAAPGERADGDAE